jgi:hypothetical protein
MLTPASNTKQLFLQNGIWRFCFAPIALPKYTILYENEMNLTSLYIKFEGRYTEGKDKANKKKNARNTIFL